MRILAVDDEPLVLKMITKQVKRLGCIVQSAEDGREALARFAEFAPDMVLTDIKMPVMDGLELLKALRDEHPEVIVVVITGVRSLEVAAEALRLGAHNYLDKPFTFAQIRQLIDKYRPVVESMSMRRECEAMVATRQLRIEFDNRVRLVPALAAFLVSEAGERLPDGDRTGVMLGLVELLMNAVEHGNLAIGSEAKLAALATGTDALEELREERRSDPVLGQRRVVVDFRMDAAGGEWVIVDEGEGFDWQAVRNPLSAGAMELPCGRGIFLSRVQFDELEYQDAGNSVRVRKLFG